MLSTSTFFNIANRLLHALNLLFLFRCVDPRLGFVGVIQEGKHPVILVMRNRIKFVGVALSTLCRKTEDRFSQAVHPIEHLNHAKLFGDDGSFFIEHAVAQESSGDDLVLSRVRQQVTSNLFDQELIV